AELPGRGVADVEHADRLVVPEELVGRRGRELDQIFAVLGAGSREERPRVPRGAGLSAAESMRKGDASPAKVRLRGSVALKPERADVEPFEEAAEGAGPSLVPLAV